MTLCEDLTKVLEAQFSDPFGPGQGRELTGIGIGDHYAAMAYHQAEHNRWDSYGKSKDKGYHSGKVAKMLNHHAGMYHAHKLLTLNKEAKK